MALSNNCWGRVDYSCPRSKPKPLSESLTELTKAVIDLIKKKL